MTGWIGSDIKLNAGSRSVVEQPTVEVTFTITEPFETQRADGPAVFAETYHTVFTLNRDEDDPH